MGRLTSAQLARFMSHVDASADGCWLWTAALNAKGYAWFSRSVGSDLAHRASYEHHKGPVPEGFTIDHLCRVRHCVNPAHLEAVPHRVNVLRGEGLAAQNARKTHCPRGHEYNEQNSVRYEGNGGRQCLLCRKENMAAYKARQANAAGGETGWRIVSTDTEANTSDEACRTAFLKEEPKNVAAIVAVPARSWNPKPIRVEPKAVLGD